MTGYGAAEGQIAGGTLQVEIRSVNHRFLNLSLKLPHDLTALETALRERLQREFTRGHVTAQLRWISAPTALGPRMVVNPERALEAATRLRELQAAAGIEGDIPLELVARQPEVFVPLDEGAPSVAWEAVEPTVGLAVRRFAEARVREGEVLAKELRGRLDLLQEHMAQVAEGAPGRLARERDRLRAVIATLLGGQVVDEQRLAQEIAFLAERLDITEELVRLGAHLELACKTLGVQEPVGKQLGFLAQEIGREVNTIGSKANDAAIQHTVIAMKGELERFREQLENLE
ncbi:MAG: YicC family protein [Gemmatimonadales bacterium]|nr:YicC family protein [Gemmatimonadales bacterium]